MIWNFSTFYTPIQYSRICDCVIDRTAGLLYIFFLLEGHEQVFPVVTRNSGILLYSSLSFSLDSRYGNPAFGIRFVTLSAGMPEKKGIFLTFLNINFCKL